MCMTRSVQETLPIDGVLKVARSLMSETGWKSPINNADRPTGPYWVF